MDLRKVLLFKYHHENSFSKGKKDIPKISKNSINYMTGPPLSDLF
jgi:hypothetical protein